MNLILNGYVIGLITFIVLLFASLCWTGYLILVLTKRNQQIDQLRTLLDGKERALREVSQTIQNYQEKAEAFLKNLNTQTHE